MLITEAKLCVTFLCFLISTFSEMSEAGNSPISSTTSKRAVPYNGEWDMSARQTALLCEARHHRSYDGSYSLPEPKKSSYLRDGVCWKNAWIPCDNNDDDRLAKSGALSHRRKPCGHFKMVAVPKHECEL